MKKDNFMVDCTTYNDEFIQNGYIDDQLVLTIEDIDDLATAWIVSKDIDFFNINNEDKHAFNENTTDIYPRWLWRSGGDHGNGTVNITQWFHNNHEVVFQKSTEFSGYMIIAIHDFEYKSFLLPGGKWSFDAKLMLNGNMVWNKHIFQSSTKKYGIKYIKIFSINIGNKKIKISETVKLKDKERIIDKLLESYNYYKIKNNMLIKA